MRAIIAGAPPSTDLLDPVAMPDPVRSVPSSALPDAPVDRRGFLAAAGLALAAACTRANGDAATADSPRVADTVGRTGSAAGPAGGGPQPRSPVGLQLYTVRTALQRDFVGTMEQVAAIGYREVEFAGYYERSPDEVRALLGRLNLQAPAAHVPWERTGDGWPAALAEAKAVGHQYVIVPWLPESVRGSVESWRGVAKRLNEAGAAARDAGLSLGYHNHDFEFRPVGGQIPYDLLLAETDPALVAFELDLYWTVRAGHDPIAYFTRHPNRFRLVHVKDSAGPPDHRMTDVGAGSIPFDRILPAAAAAGVRHFIVEHDEPADPMASIRASYQAMTTLAPARS